MLLLIDGHSLVHRAYHAFPKTFTSPTTGELTGAVYGFTRILLLAIKQYQPEGIAVAFDPPGKTFRDEAFAQYKGTRVAADQALHDQIPRIKEVVAALGISACEVPGFEADDALATFATQAADRVVIMSGDRDLLQLVSDRVSVAMPTFGSGGLTEYTPALVEAKLGVRPDQVVDYKALRGDPSDNYKGVPGIGEKTAATLLKEAETVEVLLAHPPEKYRQLLQQHAQTIRLGKQLAELRRDVPLSCQTDWKERYQQSSAEALFDSLGFRSLIRDLP